MAHSAWLTGTHICGSMVVDDVAAVLVEVVDSVVVEEDGDDENDNVVDDVGDTVVE